MRKLVITFTLAILLVIASGAVSYASTGKTNYPNVNFRSEATTDSESMLKIPEGSTVEVIEDLEDWYKIKYDGKTGYIYAEYLDIVSSENPKTEENKPEENKQEEPKKEEQKTENTGSSELTVYVMPLLNSTKLATISSTDEIKVLSEAGKWSYIQSGSVTGWVITSKFKKEEVKTEEPKADEELSKELDNVIEDQGNDQEQVQETNNNEESKEYNGAYPVTMYVSVETVNVRSDASIEAEPMAVGKLNQEFKVTAKYGDWYEVEVNGVKGYISAKYMSEYKKTE